MTPERLAQRDRLAAAIGSAYDTGWRDHEAGIRPRRNEVVAARLIAADVRAGEWPRCEHGAVREPCVPCSEAANHTGMHRLAAGSDRCIDCGARVGPDEGLRAAAEAVVNAVANWHLPTTVGGPRLSQALIDLRAALERSAE